MPTITDQQRTQLDTNGYIVLENVFTPDEMNALAEKIEAFQRRHEEKIREQGGTQGISRASGITFTTHLAERDETIAEFVKRPEFVSLSTQILGPDTDLYWNQSVFKMPEGQKEFPWRQDDGYTPVTPSPYLTVWLALNDATEENGCISVLPGSHKNGLMPHTQSPLGKVCHPHDHPDQGVLAPVGTGGMIAFWSLTAHKSGANRSNGPRKAYVIQYSHAGLRNAKTGEVLENKIPVARNGKAA